MDDYRLLQEMQRRGLLTMRVNALLRPGGAAAAVLAAIDESGLRDGEGDAWLRVGGVKLAVDGGFEGGLMREPYAEPWGEGGWFRGLQIMTRPAFEEVVLGPERARLARGHARRRRRGDRPGPRHLREGARRKAITGRRWSIEHAFIGRPDHLPRDQGAGPGPRGAEPSLSGRAQPGGLLGPGPGGLTTPVRIYLDAGLPVSSGTDAPVVPYPPLWTLYHFVTRDTLSGGVLGARSAGDAGQKALRMATIGNAWLTMEERDKGSLEAGKLADLVVLSDDPMTCPEPRLRDAAVLVTIVGGRVVYDRLK